MKQFLIIVFRNQFNLFYRFGFTTINIAETIEFEGEITDIIKNKIVSRFAKMTPFQYDEEYLIMHFEKDQLDSEFLQLNINDVISIYPLSQQAKSTIETKIDPRIRLEEPIFESILPFIELEIVNKEVEKAISALWTICEINDSIDVYMEHLGLENLFKGLDYRRNGIKSNKIKSGNYWEYLIAYDRTDYFPNSTLGFFYDAGQVFAHFKGDPTFEGSGIYTFLESINNSNPTIKLPEIIKYLESHEKLKGYVSQTTIGDVKQYIIAPIYIMLRDEIRKSDDITKTNLFQNLSYLKTFDNSFKYVIILLGAFFGFRKFYDQYYDKLNLRFYKAYNKNRLNPEDTLIKGSAELDPSNNKKLEELNNLQLGKPLTTENNEVTKNEVHKTNDDVYLKIVDETKLETNIQKTIFSDDSDQIYFSIIEELFINKTEVELKNIAEKIEEKTGKKIKSNTVIKNIINKMDNFDLAPRKKSKPETAIRKSNTIPLL